MSPGGIGSDLAGSIRIPAHFCGIAGLKPGTGRVPGAGQFPESIGPYSLGSVIGPMARTIEDLQLFFSVLASSKDSHRSSEVLEQRGLLLRGPRAAVYTEDGAVPVTEETHMAVIAVANALAQAGLIVDECRPPGVERGLDLWLKLFSRTSVVQLRDAYSKREDEAGPFVRWRLATADDTSPPTLCEFIPTLL